MKIKNDEKFIIQVEKLIEPMEIGNLSFFQSFKKMLPSSVFKKLLVKTSQKTPYMGFVIDPYCFFMFFRLKDIELAKSMLPDRYELTKARIFADDEPDYYSGMGIFNTRASTFFGTRLESYIIAKDRETGLLSFIFTDILSDTLIALPKAGVADPNSKNPVFTTNSKGFIYLDIKEDGKDRQLKLKCNIKNGRMRGLDQPLWINGNTSIAHSKELEDKKDDPFAVIFDPAEVEKALDIPSEDIKIEKNTLFPGLSHDKISKAVCFPYAQHYMADSPGCRTFIENEEDMIKSYNKIANMKGLKTFSTKPIRRMLFAGMIITPLIMIILTILLLLRI